MKNLKLFLGMIFVSIVSVLFMPNNVNALEIERPTTCTELYQAINRLNSSVDVVDRIILDADIECTGAKASAEFGKDFVFDLNGHTIEGLELEVSNKGIDNQKFSIISSGCRGKMIATATGSDDHLISSFDRKKSIIEINNVDLEIPETATDKSALYTRVEGTTFIVKNSIIKSSQIVKSPNDIVTVKLSNIEFIPPTGYNYSYLIGVSNSTNPISEALAANQEIFYENNLGTLNTFESTTPFGSYLSNVYSDLKKVVIKENESNVVVTFNLNYSGAGVADTEVVVTKGGTIATLPTDPTREGYKFGGWCYDAGCSQKFNRTAPINDNIQLYADWKKERTLTLRTDEGRSVRIEYGGNGGTYSNGKTLSIPEGTNVYVSAASIGPNYAYVLNIVTVTSVSVTKSGNAYTFTMPEHDANVTAVFGNRSFDLTYDPNGGTGTAYTTQQKGTYTLPTQPTTEMNFTAPAGKEFKGWSETQNGTIITEIQMNDTKTVYAIWGEITHEVTFITNGGSAIDPQDVVEGGKATEPTTPPTKPGYGFAGWYTDASFSTEFDFNTMTINGNTNVYAKWLPTSDSVTLKDKEFTYDGTTKTPTFNGFDADSMQVVDTSDVSEFKAGEYTILVAPKESWAGGSTTPVSLTWKINKYPTEIVIKPVDITGVEYTGTEYKPTTFTYTGTLVEGDSIVDVKYEGSLTNVGTETSSIKSFKIMRGSTNVAASYNLRTENGTINVIKFNRPDVEPTLNLEVGETYTKDDLENLIGMTGLTATLKTGSVGTYSYDNGYTSNTKGTAELVYTIDAEDVDGDGVDELSKYTITVKINVDEKITYTYDFLDETGEQTFIEGKVSSYRVRIHADDKKFVSLKVNGELFTKDTDYEVSHGSTIIQFTPAGINKLNKLTAGDHDVEITFADESVNATLKLTANHEANNNEQNTNTNTNTNVDNPKTFDGGIMMYIVIAILSILGLSGAIIVNKKRTRA